MILFVIYLIFNCQKMSTALSVTELQVENVTFPPTVKPTGFDEILFLGGAGVRGMDIRGNFTKFTAIGVYLEDDVVDSLAVKWKGKKASELTGSVEFFKDVATGAFEKFIRITMILPLTGPQYSEKVSENCVAIWKSHGIYTDEEAKAIEKFNQVFKDEKFPPGSSILFTISDQGYLTIGFSKDSSVPAVGKAVIENKLLGNSVLESIIGKDGVSPATKQSLASRLSALFDGVAADGVKKVSFRPLMLLFSCSCHEGQDVRSVSSCRDFEQLE